MQINENNLEEVIDGIFANAALEHQWLKNIVMIQHRYIHELEKEVDPKTLAKIRLGLDTLAAQRLTQLRK